MNRGSIFLKILAFAGTVLMLFPLIAFAQVIDFGAIVPLRLINSLAAGGAAALIGAALRKPLNSVKTPIKTEKARFRYAVFAKLCAIASGLIIFPLSGLWTLGTGEGFALIALISFCCFEGFKKGDKDFTEIYSPAMLSVFTVLALSLTIYLELAADLSNAKNVLIYTFLFEFAIATILLNQTNVERQALRRRDISALIPRNLRAFNLSLIIPVFMLFALGYAFRVQIAAALSFMLGFIVKSIMKLMSLVETEPSEVAPDPDFTPAEIAAEEPVLGIIGVIVFVIYIALIAFVLFKTRRVIWESIIAFVKRIIALFKPRFSEAKTSAVYTDYFEDIVYEKKSVEIKPTSKDLIKLYSKEKDAVKKIRLSYKIFLLWLKRKGAVVEASDTSEAHIARLDNPEALTDYALLYSEARYGEVSTNAITTRTKLADDVVNGARD